MSATSIREAVEKVSHVLATQPDKARSRNQPATASLSDGLKCLVTGPNGEEVRTDMPRGIGGEASAPNPGWLLRAALASCNATCIALRAAKLGVELSRLEVTVSSDSDQRGMLGVADNVDAGLQNLQVDVLIAAPGRSPEELQEMARWACSHSPVGSTNVNNAKVQVRVA